MHKISKVDWKDDSRHRYGLDEMVTYYCNECDDELKRKKLRSGKLLRDDLQTSTPLTGAPRCSLSYSTVQDRLIDRTGPLQPGVAPI